MASPATTKNPRPVKFNFDNVFAAAGASAQPAQPRARSSYSSDEVDAIRQQSFAQGKTDTEAMSAVHQAQTLGAIARNLATLIAQFDAAVVTMRQESAMLALGVGRKLAGAALAAYPLQEVEALVADCLRKMHDEPRLVVSVSPGCADPIRAGIDALCERQGFAGRVVILAEPALTGADCRVEWAHGGVERDLSQAFASIEQCAERWRASTTAQEN